MTAGRASVGCDVYCASAVGCSLSLLLLSAGPFFLPQGPAGGLKFTTVSHSSSRCGRKRPAVKGRRQERGAGKKEEAGLERSSLSACSSGSPNPSRGTGGRGLWRALSEVAVPLLRPVDGPSLAGTVVALGRLLPLFPYLWA